jgi:excisionase family DNA binding protein
MAASAPLAQALIEALDEPALDALAELLAPRLAARFSAPAGASPWLDASGAAEYLATTRGRLYDLVQLGKLSPRRDGRRLLFRRDDLDRYLAAP